jgi:hypothetical protein
VVTLALKKYIGLVLAWKSGLKVPFLPLGRFCPLQTVLLGDLVGCDSPLQIVMAFWSTIVVSRGLSRHTLPGKFEFKQKGLQTAVTISRGLSAFTPKRGIALPSDNISGRFFQAVEKPSDDINSHLFLMKKKG